MGHVRYSTAGENSGVNVQPLLIDCKFGEIAVCHNGNLVNDQVLRKDLVDRGSIFRTNSDPRGFRPLVIGKLGDSYVFCSETCALDLIDATYVREVEPGELVVIDKNGLRSITTTWVAHSSNHINRFGISA